MTVLAIMAAVYLVLLSILAMNLPPYRQVYAAHKILALLSIVYLITFGIYSFIT